MSTATHHLEEAERLLEQYAELRAGLTRSALKPGDRRYDSCVQDITLVLGAAQVHATLYEALMQHQPPRVHRTQLSN